MNVAQPSLDSVIIGSQMIAIHDQTLPIFDPTKKASAERMVLNTGRMWNVLVFYPADFSFVCPTELYKLNELYPQFLSENAEVLTISRDSVLVHERWIESDPKLK
jgi:alkyl hydroperoxide reductase subunit AhpC